jgi:hypothetical protein
VAIAFSCAITNIWYQSHLVTSGYACGTRVVHDEDVKNLAGGVSNNPILNREDKEEPT